jgi:hypothetical protein
LIERATPANVDDQIAGILALAKQSAAVSSFTLFFRNHFLIFHGTFL